MPQTGALSTRVARWLRATLLADAALTGLVGDRVYGDPAPAGAAYPLVVIAFTSATDTGVLPLVRLLSRLTVTVKVVALTTAEAEAVCDRIDALLQGASGATSGATIHGCDRTAEIAYTEPVGTDRYQHLGGTYRVVAQAT